MGCAHCGQLKEMILFAFMVSFYFGRVLVGLVVLHELLLEQAMVTIDSRSLSIVRYKAVDKSHLSSCRPDDCLAVKMEYPKVSVLYSTPSIIRVILIPFRPPSTIFYATFC